MKTRGRKLMSDGEQPGIWTERGWADQRHPQRFVNVPPPDGLSYRPGPPATHSIGANVDLSWVNASDTSYAETDATITQAYGVLRRAPTPWMFGILNTADTLFIGQLDPTPSSILWGGWEIQWDGSNLTWVTA